MSKFYDENVFAFYDELWCSPFLLEGYVAESNGRSFLDFSFFVSLCCFYGGVGGSPGGLFSCDFSSRVMLGYSCAFYDPWDQFLYHFGRDLMRWDLN